MVRFISPAWFVLVLVGFQSYSSQGQSLLDALDTEPTAHPVTATFKDTRVINDKMQNASSGRFAFCHCPSIWKNQRRSILPLGT